MHVRGCSCLNSQAIAGAMLVISTLIRGYAMQICSTMPEVNLQQGCHSAWLHICDADADVGLRWDKQGVTCMESALSMSLLPTAKALVAMNACGVHAQMLYVHLRESLLLTSA